MRYVPRLVHSLLLVAVIAPARLVAQEPVPVALRPANARLAEEFTALTGVRELRDGRVLLTDPRDNRLVVGDFHTGTVQQVGRVGNGPNEYPRAFPVLALEGDSSLMANGLNERWLLLDGAEIVSTSRPSIQHLFVYGADRTGNIVSTMEARRSHSGRFDSSYVVRLNRNTGRLDTLARLAEETTTARAPYPDYERVIGGSDGWLAVIRQMPYRVDWRSPAGAWVHGAPIPVQRRPFNTAERAGFLKRRPLQPGQADYDWPAVVPATAPNFQPLISPDGKLVVYRTPTVALPGVRYDVIDRRGVRERELLLPAGQWILGFGAASVFVVVTDDDGIERLERHPWP